MEYTREITLDFSLHEVVPFVRVKQGDASTRSILAYLKQDGETYIPDNDVMILFRCEKPDRHGVLLDGTYVDEDLQQTPVTDNRDGTVTIELVDQCTTVVGKCYCDLCFIKDDEILSTLPFVLDVRYSPDVTEQAVSSDDFRTLANALAGTMLNVNSETITGGHRITITGYDSSTSFNVMDGAKGDQGPGITISGTVSDVSSLPSTAEQGTFYNVGSSAPFQVYMYETGTGWISQGQLSGDAGPAGAGVPSGGLTGQVLRKRSASDYDTEWINEFDGLTLGVDSETITGGHSVTVSVGNDTASFNVMDGTDGVSPSISVSSITGGHRVTVQADGSSTSFDVMDGVKGDTGIGFQVAGTVASVSDLPGTADQGTFYNVGTAAPYQIYMYESGHGWYLQGTLQGTSGQDGADGAGVPLGGDPGQILRKLSATDYDTEWVDEFGIPVFVVKNGTVSGTYTCTANRRDLSDYFTAENYSGTEKLPVLRYYKSYLDNTTTPPGNAEFEEYGLVKAYTTSAYIGSSDSYLITGHFIFGQVGMTGSDIKYKTFTVEHAFDQYSGFDVTYHEESLTLPQPASGVSF